MRQLTSLDAALLALEDGRAHGHVAILAILDPSTTPHGQLTSAMVRELLESRLHMLPPFRWRLRPVPWGIAHPYWTEDASVDLAFHVRELALPAPGEDQQLAEQVARLHALPLDRGHPLWELYLISGLTGGRMAMLIKMHHAAIDGLSGAELMRVLLDRSPTGRELPPAPVRPAGERVPGSGELLALGLGSVAVQPVRALRAVPGVLPHLDQLPNTRSLPGAHHIAALSRRLMGPARDGQVLESPALPAPRTSLNGPITPHRSVAFATLPLEEVKAVQNHLGGTVNDVVMALCAGALRRRMQARGELPAVPLLALVPASVRTREQLGTWGNRFTAMVVPLPTNEPDAVGRLESARAAMGVALERQRTGSPTAALQDVHEFVPPVLLSRGLRLVFALMARGRLALPANLVVSNVRGPRVPLFCAGARVEACYPVSGVMDGVGLNITVFGYRDHLDFGLVGDRELVPDLEELVEDLRAELAALRALVP